MDNLVTDLNEENFEQFVADDGIAVVDFWASWCGPCRALAPTIEALAQKLKNNAKFGKLNVDETPRFAVEYGVESIPNVCVFKGGKLVDRSIGYVAESQLEETIKKHI